jgi:hypothetical protein
MRCLSSVVGGGRGWEMQGSCHDAIPNVRYASKLKLSATDGFLSSTISKLLRISRLPNTHPIYVYISTPHALSHLPHTPAHLPHRLKYDQRILPIESRAHPWAHHLQHPAARSSLQIYAQHPLPGCAIWIIKQHGGQHKLPGAEDRGRVADAALARCAYIISSSPDTH